MAFYELTLIVRQDISAQGVSSIADNLMKLIEEDEASALIKKEYWGLRQLAYPIKKNYRGHYLMLGFESSGNSIIGSLENHCRIAENILRYLVVKVDNIDAQEPSAVLKAPEQVELRG